MVARLRLDELYRDADLGVLPPHAALDEIACAELCGQQHYKMRAYMLSLPAEEYAPLMQMQQAAFQRQVAELSKKYPVTY